MSNAHTFPQANYQFNIYANAAVSFLITPLNASRLKVSADNVNLLTGLINNWNENWQSFIDPVLHNTIINKKKNSLRRQVEEALRTVYGDIPRSALTVSDRSILNLKARNISYARVPVLNHAPVLVIEGIQHLQHKLRFGNPATPKSKAMPYGQRIVLESFTGAAGLPDAGILFGAGKNVTRANCTISFTGAQVSQTCYYRCCYENTHGARGPWSATEAAVVA